MRGFLINIEEATLQNTDYRRVLYTTYNSQLVLMSLKPGEEIGSERHGLDQFIRLEQGKGKAIIDEEEKEIVADDALVIPAGTWHNIMNTGEEDIKLYTLYTPPEHKFDTVQPSKTDEVEDHFDGVTNLAKDT
ncbi:MAG: cupin domain-containing protein [Candidatus Nomurabacteria bacterium]|nr:MAG: cupin domain-containing protein [Candidatus Nomurabacteria bacterium]